MYPKLSILNLLMFRWCKAQKSRVAVVERDIPPGVLPRGVSASLADMKVSGGKRRVPDDKIYNQVWSLHTCYADEYIKWYIVENFSREYKLFWEGEEMSSPQCYV